MSVIDWPLDSDPAHPLTGAARSVPASMSACRTQSRTAVSVKSKSLATCPIDRSPRRRTSTISGVNARRGPTRLVAHVFHDEHPPGASQPHRSRMFVKAVTRCWPTTRT
jgi:hypothetical protein